MASHSAAERAALADALTDAGPHLPTLCDGWTTTELAAHLVTRERRPDAAIGNMLPAMAGWTGRVQGRYARRAYADLVATIRNGPPRISPLSFSALDERANLIEHFVHCEDVRRARPNWTQRDLPAERQRALWGQLSVAGKRLYRRSTASVSVRTPEGRSRQLLDRGPGADVVTLVGEPAELILYSVGRKDHARVQLEGPDDAVTAFRRLSLKV